MAGMKPHIQHRKFEPSFIDREVLHKKLGALFFAVGFLVGIGFATFVNEARASGMTANAQYNPASVAITGGTVGPGVTGGAGLVPNQAINAINVVGSGTVQTTTISLANNMAFSSALPVIASGFSGSATIDPSSTTAAMIIYIGTLGITSTGVITLPLAANGWNCTVTNPLTAANALTTQTASTTTSATFANYTISTLALINWPSAYVLRVNCAGH